MNLPGFSAEASLGPTIGLYQSIRNGFISQLRDCSAAMLAASSQPPQKTGGENRRPTPRDRTYETTSNHFAKSGAMELSFTGRVPDRGGSVQPYGAARLRASCTIWLVMTSGRTMGL